METGVISGDPTSVTNEEIKANLKGGIQEVKLLISNRDNKKTGQSQCNDTFP